MSKSANSELIHYRWTIAPILAFATAFAGASLVLLFLLLLNLPLVREPEVNSMVWNYLGYTSIMTLVLAPVAIRLLRGYEPV